MEKFVTHFEKYISYALMAIAMMGIVYLTVDLFWVFGGRLLHTFQNREFEYEMKGKPAPALFFTILLWLEILQSVRIFSHDHSIKLKIILIVGMIAVTRKILLMDMSEVDPMSEFAVAALVIALSLGYYFITRSEKENTLREQ